MIHKTPKTHSQFQAQKSFRTTTRIRAGMKLPIQSIPITIETGEQAPEERMKLPNQSKPVMR